LREIRFRGKRVDNGGWVYGDLIQPQSLQYKGTKWISNTDNANYGEKYPVIPETVGQFTGLHDKNNVPIYEGDVTTRINDNPICLSSGEKKYPSWIIDFQYGGWHFESNPASPSISYPSFYSNAKYMEVIGNIHDNPEIKKAN